MKMGESGPNLEVSILGGEQSELRNVPLPPTHSEPSLYQPNYSGLGIFHSVLNKPIDNNIQKYAVC